MKASALHAAYERVIARALREDDPVAYLRGQAASASCPARLRRMLLGACAHEAGLRLSALISARLRFERLVQGSPRAAELFAADAARFARLFRAYHQMVPPKAHGPRGEAELFEAWFSTGTAKLTR